MKKIILSVAVAAMALSTTASALEDIKVSGQAKLWYETTNAADADLFSSKPNSSGEVVFKLGMTGKQGAVGFGAEVTQGSSMGLEGNVVGAVRTSANNLDGSGDMYVSKAYFTAPVAPDTIIKMGRQELNTPFAFTEKWNAQQNNFDALVAINSSVKNLTLIAAFVGQTNTAGGGNVNHKATESFNQMWGGAYAAGALYKNDMFSVNGWAYDVKKTVNNQSTMAYWVDAGVKLGPVNVKAIVAMMAPSADAAESTTGFAASAGMAVGGVKLFAAGSMVGEGTLPLGNVATNFKKTKLPTAGVYTDGKYVAMPESTAFKLKAAGKLGSTGLLLQGVMNTNDSVAAGDTLDTMEIDFIISQKLGAFNMKGILMHRDFDTEGHDAQQHVRVIASVNF